MVEAAGGMNEREAWVATLRHLDARLSALEALLGAAEVTPEMIEAGEGVLAKNYLGDGIYDLRGVIIREIFLAMRSAEMGVPSEPRRGFVGLEGAQGPFWVRPSELVLVEDGAVPGTTWVNCRLGGIRQVAGSVAEVLALLGEVGGGGE